MITAATADFRSALPEGGRLLGLDVGTKTIGTALCDAGWTIATAAELIRRSKFSKDLEALQALARAHGVVGIIIGLPLNLDGTDSPRTQSVRAFARNLEKLRALAEAQRVTGLVVGLPLNLDGSDRPRTQSVRAFARNLEPLGLPILLWDERWSTQAVTRTLLDADASRARRAELVDKMAAAYILQGAIDALTMG